MLQVKEKINIHSTGKFLGDVRTPVFIMEEGAIFDGMSHMAEITENKNEISPTDWLWSDYLFFVYLININNFNLTRRL